MSLLIAFDLDGVLYTSERFLGEAYREAIARVEKQRPGAFPRVPTTAEILEHVGWPVDVILRRLFPDADDQAVRLLNTESLRVICEFVERGEGTLFDSVGATLERLASEGIRMVVASNGRRPYVEAVLRRYGITRFFGELVSVGCEGVNDKAGILRAYLGRYGLSSRQMLMVGDRASDVEAARLVGCRFVGCDYGHGYRSEIEGAGPILSSIEGLLKFVSGDGSLYEPEGRVG